MLFYMLGDLTLNLVLLQSTLGDLNSFLDHRLLHVSYFNFAFVVGRMFEDGCHAGYYFEVSKN